jgi:hypothetical protein
MKRGRSRQRVVAEADDEPQLLDTWGEAVERFVAEVHGCGQLGTNRAQAADAAEWADDASMPAVALPIVIA